MTPPTSFAELPSFDALPNKKRYWPSTEPAGRDEGLGLLRYLTPAHVANVVRNEVRTGDRVCLNWDMTRLERPGFNRKACEHEIVTIPNHEGIAWDDVWTFNPQAGSQWDGFRHFSTEKSADDKTRVWYGGTTSDEITDKWSSRIGIGHWAQQGIAARGVLIDYVAYAEQHGRPVDGMSGHAITLEEVLAIAKANNVTFQPGDILFLRCGFTRTWESLSLDEKQQYRENTLIQKHKHTGIVQSEEVIRFLWDNHFAAVAGDGVSFEVRPCRDTNWSLHHILLPGWGMPIGEMFDLERLAVLCKQLSRYSFFVTSSPLNHPRAVASPPGCMALF